VQALLFSGFVEGFCPGGVVRRNLDYWVVCDGVGGMDGGGSSRRLAGL